MIKQYGRSLFGLLRTLTGLVWLAIFIGMFRPARPAWAQATEPVKFRVEITEAGFNGSADDFTLEVEQGALVEITFVWAHPTYPLEEHIIVLEKYNLETDKLTAENREATLTFIADKSGTFNFRCDLECELLHDYLQKGYLKVIPKGSEGATFTPTILSVTPSSWVTGGDPIQLMAVLKDAQGAPVAKAGLRFTLAAEFAGAQGEMEVGRAKTDTNGVAFLDYQPTLGASIHKLTAHFEGMGIYAESQQSVEIQGVGMLPPAYTTPPLGLESIRHWAPQIFAIVVLSVWVIFGYVVYGLYRIKAISRRGH